MRPIFVLLTMAAAISISSTAAATTGDITAAAEEMQRANYFTFTMLLNMAPPNAFNGNVTFLMPNDRTLAAAAAAVGGGASVLDFLLRQSIPSALLMELLEHVPTGSMIPASKPGFMFKVSNGGRRKFSLSNVRITSPNICTRGNSVRCHGVDGVADPAMVPQPDIPPTPPCVVPMIPAPPSSAPPDVDQIPPPVSAPSPSVNVQVSRQKSSTSRAMVADLLTTLPVMMLWLVCV